MEAIGARPEETLVIGDKLDTDVAGARAAGLDAIWFCPGKVLEAAEQIEAVQVQRLEEIPALLF